MNEKQDLKLYTKRMVAVLLAVLLASSLCSCRVRTSLAHPDGTPEMISASAETSAPGDDAIEPDDETSPEEIAPEESKEIEPVPEKQDEKPQREQTADAQPPLDSEEPEESTDQAPDPEAPSLHDDEAERREYSSDASGELDPEAETPLYTDTEPHQAEPEYDVPPEAPAADGEGSGKIVNAEGEDSDLTATETVAADESDKLGVDDSGETADSMQTYYMTLLDSRLGALFECKRLYVYWESTADHTTVYRTSAEHGIIIGAGAYDVAAKLLEENLEVDDGWVVRKDPEVIVKVVEGGALDTVAASALCSELAARDGWKDISAVRERRVIVLSERLLGTNAGRTAAMLYLAKLMYPDQTEDVDPYEALRALTEEASGSPYGGVYAYVM